MAPEVVMGKKMPDVHTDRFSLAVVLYMLLFLNHPLEGKKTLCPCLTEELERKFYGSDPVFVWDETNDTNRPVRGVHANEIKLWPVYPKFVRDTFQSAFTHEAMIGRNIEQRVNEKEWQKVFTDLRDVTIRCSCGEETFIDPAQNVSNCINCGKSIERPMFLNVKKYNVAIAKGKKLYTCHVKDGDDYINVKGEIVSSVNNPSVLGLKNLSDNAWEAVLPNGASKVFNPGQVIRLGKGIKIKFSHQIVAEVN
jgi:serine/threonine protein kinase